MSKENPKTAAVVTLRYVVMSVLNRIKDYTMRDYKFYMQLAIEGFTELSLWHMSNLEVIYLTMNEAKVVYLPADFIDYTKIGVPINGKLRVLTKHNNILLPRTFYNSMPQMIETFVTDNAAEWLVGNVVLTSSGLSLIFTSTTVNVDFTGNTTITNISGDLTGTVVNTQANGPALKRIDTITLSGESGSASILCDGVTKVIIFDTGEEVGNTDSETAVDAASLVFFSDHFRGGQFVGGLFGMSGGIDDAYYRIDKEKRTIAFSGSVPRSQIVLEYISSGVKTDGSTLIPRQAVPALRTYLLWNAVENDARISYNEKERKKRLHEEEVTALRNFEDIFTIDEYKRMCFSTSRQTIKR
jgi:hypothetical protein